ENDRHAGDKKKQRKNKIVKAEAFPRNVAHLGAKEVADRTQGLAFITEHPVKSPDRTVAADDPEDTEPAQRIDRCDAAGCQGEWQIHVTHRTPIAISSKTLAGRKRDSLKMVAKKVLIAATVLRSRQQEKY